MSDRRLERAKRREQEVERLLEEQERKPLKSDEWWEGWHVGVMNMRLSLMPDREFLSLFPRAALPHAAEVAKTFGYDLSTSSTGMDKHVGLTATINACGRGLRLMPHLHHLDAGQLQAWLPTLAPVDQEALWVYALDEAKAFHPRAAKLLEMGAAVYGRTYAAGSFLHAINPFRHHGDGVPRAWEQEMRRGGKVSA